MSRTMRWWIVPVGALGGAALGAAARAWMRVVSTEPEFTWNGTTFIVGGFAVFGTGQALAALARERAAHAWTRRLARLVGGAALLPLFIGAGGVMAPTVIAGGLVWHRPEWRWRWRAVAALPALVPVAVVSRTIVHDHGWSPRALAGVAGLAALYAVVVAAERATFAAPVQASRALRTGFVVAGAFGVLVLAVAAVGLR